MLRTISATDLAIAVALEAGELLAREHTSRFGDTYTAMSDNAGLIEVHNTREEAAERIAAILERVR